MEDIKALLVVILKNQAVILTKLEGVELVVNDNAEIADDPRFIENQKKIDEADLKYSMARLNEFILEAKLTSNELEKYGL